MTLIVLMGILAACIVTGKQNTKYFLQYEI